MLGCDPLASLKFLPHASSARSQYAQANATCRHHDTPLGCEVQRMSVPHGRLHHPEIAGGNMTEITVLEDDLFVYAAFHDGDLIIAYDPDSTPVSVLARAMEHAVRGDLDIKQQWFDIDLNRQVLTFTPRSSRG